MGAPCRPIVLWATPRTGSTAFERMVIERGDLHVLNEPWSRAYYFGPARRSSRFTETLPLSTHAEILEVVDRAAAAGPVFVKDMPYHLGDDLTSAVVGRFRNTFIIRDPAGALGSLARMWPDFTWDEAGYEAQARAFDLAVEAGDDPVVLDSDDLRAEPERLVRAWCAAVGLPFLAEAMTWEPGLPAEWDLWQEWYARAAQTTGFTPPDDSPPPDLTDARVAAMAARARPHYERLRAARLRG